MNLQLFGGRGSSSGRARGGSIPMDEEEFLAKRGLRDASSGWTVDKVRGNRQIRTVRGKERFNKEYQKAENEYQAKRESAKAEYSKLVAQGKVRPKTSLERAFDKAHGHPDNASTQAARRMLAKRGYDWKTGKKIAGN